MALTQTQVSQLYVSVFGRASEGDGNTYWQTDQPDMVTTANVMLNTDAAKTYFGTTLDDDQAFIEHIYLNTLGKTYAEDTAGVDYWVSELAGGKSKGEVITALINAAQATENAGDAQDQFNNKVEVSNYTADNVAAFTTIDAFTALIDDVDHTDASVTEGKAEADALVPAVTYNLTNGPDLATANIFEAHRVWNPDGSDQMNSLNDDDVLVGEGSNPTLNFTFVNDTETGDMNIMPEMTNIQTINTKFTADANQTLDLQDTTGLSNLNATRIDDLAAGFVRFDNIQSALTTAMVSNSNDNTAADMIFDHAASAVSGDDDTVALTLANVQMDDLRIDGVTEGYETINLLSSSAANTLNTLTIEETNTLNITGDTDLRLGAVANTVTAAGATLVEANTMAAGLLNATGSLSVVDASEFTGDLTYHMGGELNGNADADGSAIAFAVTGGSGDDKFVLVTGNNIDAAAANTDTIDGGEGANTLVITGGAAQRVAAPTAGANLTNIQSLEIRAGQDLNAAADVVTVDADAFDSLASIIVRNEGQGAVANIANAEVMTVNLNDLTADQAAAITVLHGTTGNNGLAQNILISDVKTNSAADTLGITLEDAINTDSRFNLQLTDTALTSYESVTITDNDTEANTVQLNSFANYTGTITVTGGVAGDFMNLDAAANAYSKVTTGANGDQTTVNAANVGNFGQNAAIADTDAAPGYALDTKAGGELFVADIAAGDYAGDLIARVGTADQTITTGSGDDTIIFADRAGITSSTAGLSISDTVVGGDGTDTIVIDGTGAVNLGASEWTNLSGIDAIQVAGLAGGTTSLLITDQLVDQTDGGSNITVINNDGNLNTSVELAVTIDLRQMTATNGITFIGPNGGGLNVASSVQTVIVDDVTANGASTLNGGDRDILTDYSATGTDSGVNGGVAGTAYGTQAAADADWLANLAGADDGNNNVLAYHATTSTNEITVGDLANVSNFSTLTFDNDTAIAQTYTVTLNDTVVDRLVDASHTANTTAIETLTLTANGSATVPLATGALNLDATSLTGKFNLEIDGANGNDALQLGGNIATYVVNDGVAGGYTGGNDTVTGFTTAVDSLDIDISDFGLSGGAGDDLAAGNYYEGAIGGATAATAYDVMVLTGASYATIAAAETAVAATMTSATDGFIIFHNSTTSQVEMYFDADLSADSGAMTAADVAIAFTDLDDATDVGLIGGMFAMTDFNLIA